MFSYYSQWIAKYSEKVNPPLIQANSFALPKTAEKALEYLKAEIENAIVYSINETVPFIIEADASYHSIVTSLNQSGGRIVCFPKTLSTSQQKKDTSIEKETQTIVEALRKEKHYLTERHITLLTDQKLVAFMFDSKQAGKIKKMIKT